MLKKHLKKIVSLVLVTMMAIGMSITAIAAEPYQNELEAVMDTSPADSGQVTHYDTTTGEMLVEDGELLTFDEVAIPVPKGSADTPSERGIEIYVYSHDPNGIACIPDLLLENHLFYCVVVGGSSDRTCCSYGSDLRDP